MDRFSIALKKPAPKSVTKPRKRHWHNSERGQLQCEICNPQHFQNYSINSNEGFNFDIKFYNCVLSIELSPQMVDKMVRIIPGPKPGQNVFGEFKRAI